jgi:cell division septum initiation protein DivIVA
MTRLLVKPRRGRKLSTGQAKYDEFVSVGEAKHDVLVAQADALIAEATAEHQRLITEARERSTGMVIEAQEVRAEVLQSLGRDRSQLQKEIEQLRTFEREHRAPLKSYIEGQLSELERTGVQEPG